MLYMLQDMLPLQHLSVATDMICLLRDLSTIVEITPAFVATVAATAVRVCDRLEAALPRTEHTLMVHLLRHLPGQMRQWGAPSGYWMFFVDRCARAHYFAAVYNGHQSHAPQVAWLHGPQDPQPVARGRLCDQLLASAMDNLPDPGVRVARL
jgi:hypothetical protein